MAMPQKLVFADTKLKKKKKKNAHIKIQFCSLTIMVYDDVSDD